LRQSRASAEDDGWTFDEFGGPRDIPQEALDRLGLAAAPQRAATEAPAYPVAEADASTETEGVAAAPETVEPEAAAPEAVEPEAAEPEAAEPAAEVVEEAATEISVDETTDEKAPAEAMDAPDAAAAEEPGVTEQPPDALNKSEEE
jgi:hypothetical protein